MHILSKPHTIMACDIHIYIYGIWQTIDNDVAA